MSVPSPRARRRERQTCSRSDGGGDGGAMLDVHSAVADIQAANPPIHQSSTQAIAKCTDAVCQHNVEVLVLVLQQAIECMHV